MRGKKVGLAIVALVVLLLTAITTTASAELIRIQMEPNASCTGRTPLEFTGVESRAAAADALFGDNGSNTWNYLTVAPYPTLTTNPSFSNLLDSAGNMTGLMISFTGSFTACNDSPLDNSGSNALENEYFLIGTNTVAYTISGLPPNTQVALYLYSPNFTQYDSALSPGNTDRGYTITSNGNTIEVPSGTGTGNDALAFVTTDSSGKLSGTWSTAGNEGDWSGLQIAWPVPSLWQGAGDCGQGWNYLSWFGYFNLTYSPWVYHQFLGWLYPFGTSTTQGVWFWSAKDNAFWWTSKTVYPYIYSATQNTWYYYDAGTSNPLWFYNFTSRRWERH